MTTYIKKNQQLPDSVKELFNEVTLQTRDQIICHLVDLGWTYEAIAAACGLTRERVRQVSLSQPHPTAEELSLFALPTPPLKPERPKPVYVEPSPDTLRRLLELQPYAQQVRSNGKKYREEAEEYTALLNYAHTTEGVTLYRLAKRLGVTHGAIRFRLARYGYITPKSGKSKVYSPIIRENRISQ